MLLTLSPFNLVCRSVLSVLSSLRLDFHFALEIIYYQPIGIHFKCFLHIKIDLFYKTKHKMLKEN